MGGSENIISWLVVFVLIQSVLFGTMLLLLHSKQSRPTFLLGLFVLLFSFGLIFDFFHFNNIMITTKWSFTPINLHVLCYSFFYLYIQNIFFVEYKRPSYWVLIPGVIELIMVVFLFSMPFERLVLLKSTFFESYYSVLSFCYCMFISVLIMQRVYFISNELNKQNTSINKKTFGWVKRFVIMCMFFYLLKTVNIFKLSYFNEVTIVLINTCLIYWVTFKGITQVVTVVRLVNQKIVHQSLMEKHEAIQLLSVVKSYMEDSKCYINDKLTIVDLAEAIHVHPKRISYAINSIKGMHFNKYINFFRVNYAKVLLKSNAVRQLSIEGIGMEAGFHSKATFYSAFKSFEGTTPAKYKMS